MRPSTVCPPGPFSYPRLSLPSPSHFPLPPSSSPLTQLILDCGVAPQTPFHMHINIEMLECIYYMCSMLLEIPYMAQMVETRPRFVSKPFRRQLDFHLKQLFIGPSMCSVWACACVCVCLYPSHCVCVCVCV